MASFYRALLPRRRLKQLYRRYRWTRLTGINYLLVLGVLIWVAGTVFMLKLIWDETLTGGVHNRIDFQRNDRVYLRHLLYDEPNILQNSSYPNDLFSPTQLRSGAVILHLLGLVYMFVALAIVCDEFFVPALEVIIVRLGISEDVAGATFMAAGGSAPELFTSLIGIFVAQSDVGIGTIVGSAVFNILFVIGMCSFFSKTVLALTWWPLFRDCCFYSVAIAILLVFFRDSKIEFYEAAVLFGCYFCYVLFMKFNEKIEYFVKTKICGKERTKSQPERYSVAAALHHQRKSLYNILISHDPDEKDSETKTPPKGTVSVANTTQNAKNTSMDSIPPKPHEARISSSVAIPETSKQDVKEGSVRKELSFEIGADDEESDAEEGESEPLDMSFPAGTKDRIVYIICFPLTFLLWITVPDVRRPEREKFFIISFILSIAWIGGYSWLMVWMAATLGEVIGIPQEVMGLTVLAAGTSVPDLITSVIVAKKGHGDMAVSSSVGSNIFDITVGLPVPWILKAFVDNFKTFHINSKGLFCSITLLLAMLIAVVVSIAVSKWNMSKSLGVAMMVLYLVFLACAVTLEMDVVACPLN